MVRPELPTSRLIRRERRPTLWTTLHLFSPLEVTLSLGGKLFRRVEPLLPSIMETQEKPSHVHNLSPTEPMAILPNNKKIKCTNHKGGYHGTNLFHPEKVFNDGIPKKGDDWRLLEHVLSNENSAFRGTTDRPTVSSLGQGATYWAGEGGWVYEIDQVPTWDVGKELEGQVKTPSGYGGCPTECEVEHAIPSEVPKEKILRASIVKLGRIVEGVQTLIANDWKRSWR